MRKGVYLQYPTGENAEKHMAMMEPLFDDEAKECMKDLNLDEMRVTCVSERAMGLRTLCRKSNILIIRNIRKVL